MEYFVNAAKANADYEKLRKYVLSDKALPALVTGVSHIHKAHFISALLREEGLSPVLVIAESEGEAQKLCIDINALSGKETALLYPAKELMLGNVEAASREYEYKRIYALCAMLSGSCGAVICSAEAAAQLTVPPDELEKRTVVLHEGDETDLGALCEKLCAAGYSRTDMIEGAGQYSVRGGLVDIFPPSSAAPCRVEFWGDSIDSISAFDLETQRRTESIEELRISPAAETLFDSPGQLIDRIEALMKRLRGKRAEELRTKFSGDISRLRSGVSLHDADRFFPLC